MQSTIERLSKEALDHVQVELSSLIGTDLELTLESASLTKKLGYIEIQSGRNCIIGLAMSGSYEGEGCLAVPEQCAARLAGRMLMLPSADINEIISSNKYEVEDELRYAFDDVAKHLILSFLSLFQSSATLVSTITCQSQKIAENRKEIAEIISNLSPEQTYYQVNATLAPAGTPASTFSLLLPAFVLVCSEQFKRHNEGQNEQITLYSEEGIRVTDGLFSDFLTRNGDGLLSPLREAADLLNSSLHSGLQQEVTNLLGNNVQLKQGGSTVVPVAGIFHQADEVDHLRTFIAISGGISDLGWLISETVDGMKLGRLLTAEGAPGNVITDSSEETFSADCEDGYREICSIFLDVLIKVCQDLSESELHLEKKDVGDSVEETTQSPYLAADEDQSYWLCSYAFSVEKVMIGTIHLVLPLPLLDHLTIPQSVSEPGAADLTSKPVVPEKRGINTLEPDAGEGAEKSSKVLLIEGTTNQLPGVLTALESTGIAGDVISIAEEFNKADLESYLAVLLVIDRLDEIGLGLVIKIKSYSSLPLLIAAAQWTQKDVMKALRYGVDDIVMLPADSDELLQKFQGLEALII